MSFHIPCVANHSAIAKVSSLSIMGEGGGAGPWKFLIFDEGSATTEATEHVSASLWKLCGRPADRRMGTADFRAFPIHSTGTSRARFFQKPSVTKHAVKKPVLPAGRLPLP
jgi:hypothetical protein